MRAVTDIGLKWIAAALQLTPVQPFAVESEIGTTRRTVALDTVRLETYPSSFLPAASIGEHLKFALKYEVVHLEFLARVFAMGRHLEGPNTDIDQIIRSVRENGWVVSGKLKKAFPMLEDVQLQHDIVASVRAALEGEPD